MASGGSRLNSPSRHSTKPDAVHRQHAGAADLHIHMDSADGLYRQQDGAHRQTDAGQCHIGQHQPAQRPEAHARLGVEVQVLGIAHGGQHAAQVGRQRLQDDQRNQQPPLACHGQHDGGKRHKGDQGNVIGDDHAEDEGQKD